MVIIRIHSQMFIVVKSNFHAIILEYHHFCFNFGKECLSSRNTQTRRLLHVNIQSLWLTSLETKSYQSCEIAFHSTYEPMNKIKCNCITDLQPKGRYLDSINLTKNTFMTGLSVKSRGCCLNSPIAVLLNWHNWCET